MSISSDSSAETDRTATTLRSFVLFPFKIRTTTFIIMQFILIIFFLSSFTISSINTIAIDDYHCKVPTCRDFYYGLKGYPRHDHYVEKCYDTVYTLQDIPRKHGKCINAASGKLHGPCIHALANTIKSCMDELKDLTEELSRFYCGFTLMKYCAVHLGLEGIPLKFVPQK